MLFTKFVPSTGSNARENSQVETRTEQETSIKYVIFFIDFYFLLKASCNVLDC